MIIRSMFWLVVALYIHSTSYALGNYPESTVCSDERPYQAICTHSLHNLEGWYGQCFTTQEAAQQSADQHVNRQHNGNSRWTGVKKASFVEHSFDEHSFVEHLFVKQ